MERAVDRRLDPRRSLDGARSAVCVALQYDPEAATGDLWRGVARYARGRDYHELMTPRLRALGKRVEDFYPGTLTRAWVDTGPLLERELAAAAGLGAFGKNTNLLHPEAGSWFLLGELLTTLDLAPDPPVADLCGSCTACLDACPTGALPEPWVLDSRRCISYWTIEHRGDLPEPVRPLLGEWVFGCDVCQDVCPANAGAPAPSQADLHLPRERGRLSLLDLLALDRADYVELFRGSPMKRAKLEGLQRNAAVALGNRGRRADVAPLARALRDGADGVRRHAAWALGAIGGEEAERALRDALRVGADAALEGEIRSALARISEASSGPAPC